MIPPTLARPVVAAKPTSKQRLISRDRRRLLVVFLLALGLSAALLQFFNGATASRAAAGDPVVVRALGDSITAGYGFYGSGDPMKLKDLARCGTIDYPNLNDRCSSNSSLGKGDRDPVAFLPDYGLSNGIAWPAQVTEQLGITDDVDYANRAVTGADPKDLLAVDPATESGQLHQLLEDTVADQPDLTLMTIGANPLLGDFLAGEGTKCLLAKRKAKFRTCSAKLIASEQVTPRVSQIIDRLLDAPDNTVVLSKYPTVLPSTAIGSPTRILKVLKMVNNRVVKAAKQQPEYRKRVFVAEPPLFPYGMAPGKVACPGRPEVGQVDGASVQSTLTQQRFRNSQPDSFCPSAKRWIISADLGVHPSKAGHEQIASSVSALIEGKGLLPAE